jgi:hypothetical protein
MINQESSHDDSRRSSLGAGGRVKIEPSAAINTLSRYTKKSSVYEEIRVLHQSP